jgi:hypothetical protein
MAADEREGHNLLPGNTPAGAPSAPAWFKAVGRGLLRATGLYANWSLMTQGPLRADGWLRSFREGRAVDADGRPLPWITYPAIEFLSRHVRADWEVFEYGCGQSTLWWTARVAKVVACEHEAAWAERIRPMLPAGAELLHVPLDDAGTYAQTCARWPGRFDVIVIDGRQRVQCADAALTALNPRGVVVWDNSDREEYRDGYELLTAAGFRRVSFIGMAPIFNAKAETAVFYRDDNVLGL